MSPNRANPDAGKPERVEDLAAATQQLVERTRELIGQMSVIDATAGQQILRLARQAGTTQRIVRILGAIIAGVIVLTIGLVIGGLGQLRTNHRINVAGERVSDLTEEVAQAELVLRRDANCPVFGLFLNLRSESARQRYESGPAAYDQAYATLQRAYNSLHCSEFTRAPAPKPVPTSPVSPVPPSPTGVRSP